MVTCSPVDMMALGMEAGDPPGHVLDALGIGYRGATVLLNNQRHGFVRFNVAKSEKRGRILTYPAGMLNKTAGQRSASARKWAPTLRASEVMT
jgi:hypothetical protein